MKTAQQAAANWAGSAGRAAQAYQQGVEGFTGDWAGATLAQQSVMQTNLNNAINDGSWSRGVSAVGTSGWKQATVAKIGSYTQGFTAGAPRQAASAQKIMAALGTIVPNLPARGTYEQNKIRSTTLMDALHAQRGQLGAR